MQILFSIDQTLRIKEVSIVAKTLPGIIYDSNGKTEILDSPTSMFILPMDKDVEYFTNLESKNRFIRGCEKLIRQNDRYSKYIHEVKTKVGLNHCQVLSKLTDKDCTVEMHHGPIFTLYDYCEIMIDHYLEKGWKITTFKIADHVLVEHWANRIQIVMLSVTMHQEIHDRQMFLNMQQAWGNLHEFLKRYKLNPDLKEKYNRYYDQSMMLDSTTYELLKLNDKILEKY